MIAPFSECRVNSLLSLFNPLLGIRIVTRNQDLLRQMLVRNLAARYRGSALGFLWSFAHPLMMLAVYTFVFGIVFKARWGTEHFGDNRAAFPLIMFCGMAVFNIFSESVNTSTGIVTGNPGYVKKVVFPLELLPLCNVLTSFVFGMAWFALLFVGIAVFLREFSWTMLLLPVTLLPLLLLSAGVSFLVASLGVYLRDMQQLVGIVTQMLFFMTPIFYPVSVVPESLRWILQINPLSFVVEQTRLLFLYGRLPDPFICLLMFLVSGAVFQLGLAWFVKTKKGFADVL
jgi:ABC-type polysaccharide/polyol phosphate export systems, permease component